MVSNLTGEAATKKISNQFSNLRSNHFERMLGNLGFA
jgi:hypothetical protein